MTKISDLRKDGLDDKILSRVPLTCLKPVRSTCKNWYNFTKNQILGKAAPRKQFLGFVRIHSRVFSMVFDLQGIRNDDEDFVDPSVKQLSEVEISNIFHCDGLLLCVNKDHPRLLVWNPYLGQKRSIEPSNNFSEIKARNNSIEIQARKKYIIDDVFTLGYDINNHNHKIFRILVYHGVGIRKSYVFEIYDFNSNSRRVLDLSLDWKVWSECEPVSLKGNTYFFHGKMEPEAILLCFDFTAERFGPRLPLPFDSVPDEFDTVTLSCVRDEQLAVLYQHYLPCMVEIWITTKIEPNDISWSKFLKVDMNSRDGFLNFFEAGNFFIDEEKKVLVVFDAYGYEPTEIAYIVGEDRYFKSTNIEEAPKVRTPNKSGSQSYKDRDFKLTSYVASLVQLD